jgi:hypothetical protein
MNIAGAVRKIQGNLGAAAGTPVGYPAPPAAIRTREITSYGSCLGK